MPNDSATLRKDRPDAPPGFFAAEAAGLRWLAAAEPSGGVRCARVRDVGDDHILLERVETVRPTRAAAAALGRGLARTHAAGAAAFGAPPTGWTGPAWIGRQAQENEPTDAWGRFYALQRVLPFVRAAVDRGHLDPGGATVVERVAARLVDGDFDDDRPPARLHGDLWNGNVLFGRDGPTVIDPAAHGGHGLTDVAMLALFGCPGLDAVMAEYAREAALEPGWEDLIGLHQLHPLAVHAASHGPAYGDELVAVARRYV